MLAAVAAERAGERVDRPLLKNVLSIFIEVGMGGMDAYERDFEVRVSVGRGKGGEGKGKGWI